MNIETYTLERSEISNLAHKEQEPFITKNGYNDLVVMSSELYDKFARTNRINQVIFETEQKQSTQRLFLQNWRKSILDKFKIKISPK